MFRRCCLLLGFFAFTLALIIVTGCNSVDDSANVPVSSVGETEDVCPECVRLPDGLPANVSFQDVVQSLKSKSDISFDLLAPEVLEQLGGLYAPEDYYIDSLGLHWGHPRLQAEKAAQGNCYHAYGFSIVGSLHFVYWFHYRPPSYDAYMAWIPIYAQPYGKNGILVQKRDMCWICGCNPVCALLWTWVCAK